MKKTIMDVIVNDDSISLGQSPFKAGKIDLLSMKCHLHSTDSVLLPYDSTVFGSSKKGFILTEKGISTPDWFLSWIKFAYCSFVKESNNCIAFSGKADVKLNVNTEIDAVLDLFFRLKKALRDKIAANPLIAFDFKQALMPLIFGDEAISKYVYSNSVANIAKFNTQLNVHYGEEVLLAYDTTSIGNSKVGFIMTERGIYQRIPFNPADFLSWEDFISAEIDSEQKDPNHFVLTLKEGGKYDIVFFQQAEQVARFLKHIHAELKAAYC